MTAIHLKNPFKNRSHADLNNPVLQNQKKQNVLVNIQNPNQEIRTESGTVKFEKGIAVLPPDSRAKDILGELKEKHSTHRDHFSLIEGRESMKRAVKQTHKSVFSVPRLPWKDDDG